MAQDTREREPGTYTIALPTDRIAVNIDNGICGGVYFARLTDVAETLRTHTRADLARLCSDYWPELFSGPRCQALAQLPTFFLAIMVRQL